MWFRRRRRQSPPVLIPPLERLAELVDRVVTLLDQAPKPLSTPAPAAQQAVAQEPAEEATKGHVLVVPTPGGYRLVPHEGPLPARADVGELEGVRYRVLRVGPSPLPGDRRRCAYLEQEPPEQNRTPTSARGEPDRRDESGPAG